MNEPAIRPMNRSDLAAVAGIHLRAFPGFFLSSLGAGFLRQFYAGLLEERSAIALVTTVSDEVVGFAAGATEPRGFYRRLLVRRGVQIAVSALPAIVRRPSTLLAMIRRILNRTAGNPGPIRGAELMSVAVDPSRQGAGAGAALVRRFADEASAAGAPAVWLITDAVDNDSVRVFYERLGFEETGDFVTAEGRRVSEYVKRT